MSLNRVMKNSPEIINELVPISPLLAGLDKVNVFRVPDGYFNELHFRITDYTLFNSTSPVDNINKRNIQEVPNGYFDSLSDSILTKVKAAYSEDSKDELSEVSHVLSGVKRTNVFSTPEGYFENLSNSILRNLKNINAENAERNADNVSPVLNDLKYINVFSLPGGYFESFSDSVLTKIKENEIETETAEEELRRISPLLYSIQGENVFSVPRGYFQSFAQEVLEQTKPQPAKIVTMKKRTSWVRYAAAAVVTGIITISSFLLFNVANKNNSSDVALLPDYVKASMKFKTSEDLNAGIANLSDADIIKYLEKNGNVMDNELLINNTDVTELPSTTDYLYDNNTLNEYLKKIDAKNTNKLTP